MRFGRCLQQQTQVDGNGVLLFIYFYMGCPLEPVPRLVSSVATSFDLHIPFYFDIQHHSTDFPARPRGIYQ